jgi:hypothetical protein
MSLDLLVFRERLLIKYNFSNLTRTAVVSNYTNDLFLMFSFSKASQYQYVTMRISSVAEHTELVRRGSWDLILVK